MLCLDVLKYIWRSWARANKGNNENKWMSPAIQWRCCYSNQSNVQKENCFMCHMGCVLFPWELNHPIQFWNPSFFTTEVTKVKRIILYFLCYWEGGGIKRIYVTLNFHCGICPESLLVMWSNFANLFNIEVTLLTRRILWNQSTLL